MNYHHETVLNTAQVKCTKVSLLCMPLDEALLPLAWTITQLDERKQHSA
jgi:hypothetical protein